jgi:hypothetical protein
MAIHVCGRAVMPCPSCQKLWLHQASGYSCTSVNRRRVYLDKDDRVACRKLRELRTDQKRGNVAGNWLDAPFADLADGFLDDLKARRKSETHRSYRYRLLRALKVLKTNARVGELRKLHLAKIERQLSPVAVRRRPRFGSGGDVAVARPASAAQGCRATVGRGADSQTFYQATSSCRCTALLPDREAHLHRP